MLKQADARRNALSLASREEKELSEIGRVPDQGHVCLSLRSYDNPRSGSLVVVSGCRACLPANGEPSKLNSQ